jgi:hypothetical protein
MISNLSATEKFRAVDLLILTRNMPIYQGVLDWRGKQRSKRLQKAGSDNRQDADTTENLTLI